MFLHQFLLDHRVHPIQQYSHQKIQSHLKHKISIVVLVLVGDVLFLVVQCFVCVANCLLLLQLFTRTIMMAYKPSQHDTMILMTYAYYGMTMMYDMMYDV